MTGVQDAGWDLEAGTQPPPYLMAPLPSLGPWIQNQLEEPP
jgi:hypothetical protein